MKLKSKRILLRNFKMDDINDVFEYCSQTGVVEMAGWSSLKSKDEAISLLTQWTHNNNQYAIVLLENNKVIGHIGINEDSEENRKDTKELGFALNRYYQQKGYMSEAVELVIEYLFKQNIQYIWACCFQHNMASKRLIEKCNFIFQQVGTYYSQSLNQEFKTFEYLITNKKVD